MNDLTQDILSREQIKKLPATSFTRMWCLGSSQAKVAAYYLLYALRKNFLHSDAREQAFNETQLKAAVQLLGTMGYLRGAIMKIGQLFANLPQMVGSELVEIFESLQFEAPPMHFSLIRELFLDELGKEPEEIFAHFDKRAFAAASLGQVHRARLHNGTEVAVKIQYPDIARTIDSDFKALGFLLHSMRFNNDFQNIKAHVADARTVFSREVDYLLEAEYMEKNRAFFSKTDIVVPRSFPEYSTQRVLTMEYIPGKHLNHFLADNPSQEKRNHFGKLISQSLIQSFFGFRTVYADMHPGNYIFMDDGRIGFIDFGCYQKFTPEHWRLEMLMEESLFTNDKQNIIRQFIASVYQYENIDDMDPEWVQLMFEQVDWVVQPIIINGPFDFADKEYVQRGVDLMRVLLRNKNSSRMDCFYNWTNRAILGHRSFMYRLRAKFDYGAMYRNELRKEF